MLSVKAALAGPYAITRGVLISYAAASVAFGTIRQFGTLQPATSTIVTSLGATAIATCTLMGLAGARRNVRPRLLITIVGFAITGCVSSLAAILLGQLLFENPTTTVPVSLVCCGGYEALVWLTITAVISHGIHTYRDEFTQLRTRQRDLDLRRASAQLALAATEEQLRDLVDREVNTKISSLVERELSPLLDSPEPARIRQVASDLSEFGRSVVRPMSHELDSGALPLRTGELDILKDAGADDLGSARRRNPVAELVREMGHGFVQPGLLVIIATVLLVGPLWLVRGIPSGTLIVAIDAIVFAGVMYVARYAVGWFVVRLPSAASIAAQILVIAVAGIVVTIVVNLLYRETPRVGGELLAAGWAVAVGVGVMAFTAAARLADRARSDLTATVALAEWETQRVDADLTNAQRRVAYVLHGEVQGGLTASSMLLQQAVAADDSATKRQLIAQAIALVQEVVAEAADAGTGPPAEVGVREGTKAIADSWLGILEVETMLPDEVIKVIERSDAVSRTTLDVFREALANAARHGYSRHVQASASLDGGNVVIDFLDDGTGPQRGAITAGLGIRAIRRTGADCELSARPEGGAHLRVSLPAPVS